MTKKYSEILDFINAANDYRLQYDENGKVVKSPKVNSKLDYAIDKMILRVKKAVKEMGVDEAFDEQIRDLRTDYASEDADKNLILENSQYKYTKVNQKKLAAETAKAIKKRNETEVEYEPYYTDFCDALTEEQVEAFMGFVLPENFEYFSPFATQQAN